ncbi:hypothetical protein H8356DRAFT_1629814 [Neocallimastix lanati (nom. inval.)]|uniref:Uncharacterized protein n=1 Tax=Neocallimastix californiae TaxID=1754190 RepID=A0A1Y2ES94_9FUNG|nr:hypothetical protein H8356DRAFT_1629814 [Neocallimastix sp. JGI-2020a]ORY74461.1 hypothetical protein LY90DRAFT_666262 [Neocallimastix californiae]|eukprot:ORY74461.1 hypothetical protein LY90DRAFT_666262 [Neocallimastix californiae]
MLSNEGLNLNPKRESYNSNTSNSNINGSNKHYSISKFQKGENLSKNDIVERVKNQLKNSIEHHSDYISKYLYKSIIGIKEDSNIYNELKYLTNKEEEKIPIWKINLLLNDKTKALLESLDSFSLITGIYSEEELKLEGQDNYGYYSILIREANYDGLICYYVCTDIKVYEKETSALIMDKVMIAYVSPSLDTLNQITREYIGICEDQDNINHYILTKYRIINYKTEKQRILFSIYDENYYQENTKIILAPHILTEAGEEILSKIFGLILDEDCDDDRLLDSIEFISLIKDELKLIKFNIKKEDKLYINGIERRIMNEISEEKKFQRYLNNLLKKSEVSELKRQLEELKLENSWFDVPKDYDYLDIPKKIMELKILIDQKEEEYKINNKRKEEEEKEEMTNQKNEKELNSDDTIMLKDVFSIKKSYKTIDRNKYFINLNNHDKEKPKISTPSLNDNTNNDNDNDKYEHSYSISSKASSKSNISNCNTMEFLESIENTNNNSNESDLNNYEIVSKSSLQMMKSNIPDMNKQDSILKSYKSIKMNNDNNNDSINNIDNNSENHEDNATTTTTSNNNRNDDDDNNNNNNSTELPTKASSYSEKNLNEIEKIKNSLSKVFTKSSSSTEMEKINGENNDSVPITEDTSKSISATPTKKSSKSNSSTQVDEDSELSTMTESIENNKSIPSHSNNNSTSDLDLDNSDNNDNDNNSDYNDDDNSDEDEINKDITVNSDIITNKNNSKSNSIDSILENDNSLENIKAPISIRSITDEELDDEIKTMKDISDEEHEKEIKIMEEEKGKNSGVISTSDKSMSSCYQSIHQNDSSKKGIEELKNKDYLIVEDIENILEKEYSQDPHIIELKNKYGIEVPQAIFYPYVEYDYIHQKGYLQIYYSKFHITFNNEDLKKSQGKKKIYDSSNLLETPDAKSEFLTVKDKVKNQYAKFLKNNTNLKIVISDYLQLLLSKKPSDVYDFTQRYFK